MTTVSPATEPSVSPGSGQTQKSAESLISSNFDTWLTLLTAQLQNQDPFDPVDSTEYTAQLAQFSAVEQQVKTNDLLAEMVAASQSSDLASMADWVGRRVRVAAPLSYEGQPVTVMAQPAPTAAGAELVIRDSKGDEVNRFSIPVTESPVAWDGTDSHGLAAPWGNYVVDVESFNGSGDLISAHAAEVYATVAEVRMTDGALSLVLDGGTTVATTEVSAVRGAADQPPD